MQHYFHSPMRLRSISQSIGFAVATLLSTVGCFLDDDPVRCCNPGPDWGYGVAVTTPDGKDWFADTSSVRLVDSLLRLELRDESGAWRQYAHATLDNRYGIRAYYKEGISPTYIEPMPDDLPVGRTVMRIDWGNGYTDTLAITLGDVDRAGWPALDVIEFDGEVKWRKGNPQELRSFEIVRDWQ